MPNHWHLLLCPQIDGQLGRFMQRLTMTRNSLVVAPAQREQRRAFSPGA
jgi:hypothetical protein